MTTDSDLRGLRLKASRFTDFMGEVFQAVNRARGARTAELVQAALRGSDLEENYRVGDNIWFWSFGDMAPEDACAYAERHSMYRRPLVALKAHLEFYGLLRARYGGGMHTDGAIVVLADDAIRYDVFRDWNVYAVPGSHVLVQCKR